MSELPEKGGLVIRKKADRPPTGPTGSLLGLQRLAQQKREQENDGFKRPQTDYSRKPPTNHRNSDRYQVSPRSREQSRAKSSHRVPYERPSSNRPKSSRSEWDQTPNRSTLGGQTPRANTGRPQGSWSSVSKRPASPSSSNWEMETPRPLFQRTEAAPEGENRDDWEDNLKQIDRDWYNLEESGVH